MQIPLDIESMVSSTMTFVSNIIPTERDAHHSYSDWRKGWCTEGIQILLGFGKRVYCVIQALQRLTPQEQYDRSFRLKRASQASILHAPLAKSEWTTTEEVCSYSPEITHLYTSLLGHSVSQTSCPWCLQGREREKDVGYHYRWKEVGDCHQCFFVHIFI